MRSGEVAITKRRAFGRDLIASGRHPRRTLARESLAVDTPADLPRLEELSGTDLERLRTYPG